MGGRFLRRAFRQGKEIVARTDFYGVPAGIAGTAFAGGMILRAGKVPVPRETLQFGTEIVGRSRACQFQQRIVGGQCIPGQKVARGVRPAVQIDSGQHGFKRIGKQAVFRASASRIFAAAELQIPSQVQLLGGSEKMRGAYQMVLQQRQLALGEVREAFEQPFADQTAEDRISEEFKALVVGAGTRRIAGYSGFIYPRAMRERQFEERTIFEAIRKSCFQLFEIDMHDRRLRCVLFRFFRGNTGFVLARDVLDLSAGVG